MTIKEITEFQEEFGLAELQGLINSGLAWQLQGWFGRMATNLIEQGLITQGENDGSISQSV